MVSGPAPDRRPRRRELRRDLRDRPLGRFWSVIPRPQAFASRPTRPRDVPAVGALLRRVARRGSLAAGRARGRTRASRATVC